jgi:hypothetical protein
MVDESICPKHDWPRYQCPQECQEGGAQLSGTGWVEHPPPSYDGPRPTPDAILISPAGIAHRLGACAHLPEFAYLAPPKWGWTDSAADWSRIGTTEVPATAGNLDRVAHRRCLDCDEQY